MLEINKKRNEYTFFTFIFFFFLMFYCKVLFSDVTAYIKLKQSLCLKDKLCKYHIYKRK